MHGSIGDPFCNCFSDCIAVGICLININDRAFYFLAASYIYFRYLKFYFIVAYFCYIINDLISTIRSDFKFIFLWRTIFHLNSISYWSFCFYQIVLSFSQIVYLNFTIFISGICAKLFCSFIKFKTGIPQNPSCVTCFSICFCEFYRTGKRIVKGS